MKPTLISLGPVDISSFGFFLMISFVVFTYVVWKKSKEKLYQEEKIFDSIFFTTLATFIGARLFYVFLNFKVFGINIFRWLLFTGYPGFYFYGGVLIGIGALYYFFRKREKKIPFWEMFDNFSQAFWLAFIIVQPGILLGGVEVGKVTDKFDGVSFADYEGLRHPTALYKTAIFLVFFVVFTILGKKVFKKGEEYIPGLYGISFLFVFGLTNFLVDNFVETNVYYGDLSLNQWFNLILILLSLVLFYRGQRYKIQNFIKKLIKK